MAWFSKKTDDATAEPEVLDDLEPDDALASDGTGRPVSRPLTDDERARIDEGLERLLSRDVDVDDLGAIGAAYDAAVIHWREDPDVEGSDVLVDTFAIAIGEHLARHSKREWAVVTDVFGTDLGLVAARAETVIVPHNLVGARWMRGELGWIPGVVSHLVGMRPRVG